jgi:hypothetical protein
MIDFPLPVDEFGVPIAIGINIDDYQAGLAEVREWLAEQDGEYELVMEGY